MSIRKNFSMPEKVADDLLYLAKKLDMKQSQVIQELIEEKISFYQKERKLEAGKKLVGIFTGMLPEEVNIQWIKKHSDS